MKGKLLILLLISLLFIHFSVSQEAMEENKPNQEKQEKQANQMLEEKQEKQANQVIKEKQERKQERKHEETKKLSEEEEKLRLENEKQIKEFEKHIGHENLHNMILLGLLALMLVIQFGLVYWKKVNHKSFQLVTLIGLWIVPFLISVYFLYLRFLLFWSGYTFITFYILKKIYFENPLEPNTPRRTYSWFFWIYKISFGSSVVGYLLIMCDIFGFGDLIGFKFSYLGSMLLFYGLYYGVLGRDLAEICAEKIATSFGVKKKIKKKKKNQKKKKKQTKKKKN